jgi:diketogulonate reductase-like aldo/keto reductase
MRRYPVFSAKAELLESSGVTTGICRRKKQMAPIDLRYSKLPLRDGSGELPALGFGTLIPDERAAKMAVQAALETRFRHFDCAERYRIEDVVGDALAEAFARSSAKREDVFVTSKLWNNNRRPERVALAFEASLRRLKLDYVDLYLIHTPFAFAPGDDQDPRDADGKVIYDNVPLLDTWNAKHKSARDDP